MIGEGLFLKFQYLRFEIIGSQGEIVTKYLVDVARIQREMGIINLEDDKAIYLPI